MATEQIRICGLTMIFCTLVFSLVQAELLAVDSEISHPHVSASMSDKPNETTSVARITTIETQTTNTTLSPSIDLFNITTTTQDLITIKTTCYSGSTIAQETYTTDKAIYNGTTTSEIIQRKDNEESKANCSAPYIRKFPKDLFTNNQRLRGCLIFHFVAAFVAFVAISVLVDEYFMPSLERFCEVLRWDEDITGATIMAAGSSIPEMIIAIIGSFFSNADVSIGTIVGSAVFNILFVIGICAVVTPTVVKLNWWPFLRDSVCYLVSAIVLFLATVARLIGRDAIESQYLLQTEPNQSSAYYRFSDDVDAMPLSEPVPPVDNDEIMEIEPQRKVNNISLEKIVYYCLLPLRTMFVLTIPNCRSHKWRNIFPLSFLLSVIWLGFFCFILIWMVAVIGYSLGIPDSVMGITFVAAGTSLPDALASIHAVKSGHASMGVSNTIGSNLFDLLVVLSVPWLLQSMVTHRHINVNSYGIKFNAILLIDGMLVTVIAVKCRNFYLDRSLGLVLICCYIVYLIASLLIEMNVFGLVNMPMCPL